jgi:hypothetical protein
VSVINRRNAVLGYLTWVGAKLVFKQKAKAALPNVDAETKRPNKSAIALFAASAVGVLLFWRSRSGEDTPA